MIDGGFWQSETVARLTMRQRLLFIGLFSNADDQGRMKAHPSLIRSTVFPYDEIPGDELQADLDAIEANGCIILYEAEGKRVLQIVNWWRYQNLRFAHPSVYPPPPNWKDRWCYWNGKRAIFQNWEQGDEPGWWQKLRRRILARDGMRCQYCGSKAEHVDHILPRSRGGPDNLDNLVAACAKCNLTKGSRTPEEAGMSLMRA